MNRHLSVKSFAALLLATLFPLAPLAAGQDQDSTHIPLQELDPSATAIMTFAPGVFGFTFGASGWPDGISPLGRDPDAVPLLLDGVAFEDLLTGRPRFDLLPMALLSSIRLDSGGRVIAETDSLNDPRPLTRLRYQSAGNATQEIRALHIQNRLFVAADSTERKLQTLFGYSGAGARGEFDGSRLKRAREITVRLRYETPTWSAELLDIANRRSVGAHTGVLEFPGEGHASIFQRLGARVGDPLSRRRTIRNDLQLRGATRYAGYDLKAALFYKVQTLDFQGESFQLKGRVRRVGAKITPTRMLGDIQTSLALEGYSDAFIDGSAFDSLASGADSRYFLSLLADMAGSRSRLNWKASAGIQGENDRSWVNVVAEADLTSGAFGFNSLLRHSGVRVANHAIVGFGPSISALSSAPDPHPDPSITEAQLGASYLYRGFSFSATGFWRSENDPVVTILNESTSQLEVSSLNGDATTSGVSLEIGYRANSKNGVYASVNPVLRTSSTDERTSTAASYRQATPESWTSGRVGLRARLFTGDMNLNAYVRARYWGEMGGRRLHNVTGLLPLPENDSLALRSSWLVDFVSEAGIRGAIIFLAYENAFSGTGAQIGNLIIPDYPLPEQRLRFGVYWPIFN